MTSFFEKLKRGMGVEIPKEEAEKTEEKLEGKPLKDKIKPVSKKRKPKKVEVEERKLSSPPFAKAREVGTKVPKDPALLAKRAGPTGQAVEPEKLEVKEVGDYYPPTVLQSQPPRGRGVSLRESASRPDPKKEIKEKKAEPKKGKWFEPEGQLAVDVYQTDEELVIQSTVAGVKPEDLDISIEADIVLIKGSRERPPEDGERNYFYQECYWGLFSRQIILPEETDPNRAEATMKEGVLTIRIPKIERKKKRKIEVKR